MRAITVMLAIALSLSLSAPAYSADSAENADLTFAKNAFKDGFYDIAESRLEAFLKDHPDTPHLYEAHVILGRCYYYLNNYQKALYELELIMNAPAASGFHDEALYWIAEIYLKTGDPKKALELYQKVIDGYPSSRYIGYALYSMGCAYKDLGFFEEASAAFKEVVSKYPFEKFATDSLFKTGECEYLMAKYREAEQQFERFIEKFPVSEKTAEAYYLKGESEFYQAKYSEAAASFERALAISSSSKWAIFAVYRRASSLFQIGRHDESLAEFKKCLDISDSEFLAGLALLGMEKNYEKLGLTADAISTCERIISSYPSGEAAAEASYRKVKILYSKKDYAGAEALAKEAIARFAKSKYLDRLKYELGWIYSSLGKDNLAIEEFVWIETESKDINLSAGAVTKIGDIYFDRKEYKKALDSYDIVLTKYPDSLWSDYVQYQVGNVSFASGKYDKAILAYQNALFNFPGTPLKEKILFQLGTSYFKIGDFESSGSEFEKLVSSFPDGIFAERSRLYLASCFYNMAQYSKALEVLKGLVKSLRDEELKELARYQMAWCLYNTGKEAEAIDGFAGFLKDYPRSENAPDVVFWFAEYYDSKKQYDKAREYYNVIVNNYPMSGMTEEALYQIAGILYAEGKVAESVAKFEELATGYPGTDYARRSYRRIANIKKDLKDYDSAVEYMNKAITREDNDLNAQIQYEIAECYEAKGDLAKASEEYLRVTYIYPGSIFWSVRATLACAKIFERMEKFEDARRLYEKLADMDVEESAFAKQRIEWIRWRTTN